MPDSWMDLKTFDNSGFQRGKPLIVELIWMGVSALFVRSWIPGSAHRRFLLKAFGASIEKDVVIKPGVRVKFPWKLSIGQASWIGEDVWIDNLAQVEIQSDVCISQGVYFCTGSHNWGVQSFDLTTQPITVETGAWVAAKVILGPGVCIGKGSVVSLGGVVTQDLIGGWVYQGNPAVKLKKRKRLDLE